MTRLNSTLAACRTELSAGGYNARLDSAGSTCR